MLEKMFKKLVEEIEENVRAFLRRVVKEKNGEVLVFCLKLKNILKILNIFKFYPFFLI